jgi:hypothetical protein
LYNEEKKKNTNHFLELVLILHYEFSVRDHSTYRFGKIEK